MKTYKIKSLIFLCCFIMAAVFYYQIEQDDIFQSKLTSAQTADMDAQLQSDNDQITEEPGLE